MSAFYANITLQEPDTADVVELLRQQGVWAYVSPGPKRTTVIFPEELAAQENLAAMLSQRLSCPALVVMSYGEAILLYQLYVNGDRTDAYVSSPHEDLELGPDDAPQGDAAALCGAFGREKVISSVERILRRPTDPANASTLAINRHGELARALGLPLFAAGASFQSIELGELPEGPGFNPADLIRTGRR